MGSNGIAIVEAITQGGQYPLQRISVGDHRDDYDESDEHRGDSADEDQQIANDDPQGRHVEQFSISILFQQQRPHDQAAGD